MITTVAACKTFRNIEPDNKTHDEELERLIGVVQLWLENECGRVFDDSGDPNPPTSKPLVVEYFSGDDWHKQLILGRPPITAITDIQIDSTRQWTQPVLDPTLWYVYDAGAGIVKLVHTTLPEGVGNIRVRYRGGFQQIPTDLEQAAIELVWAARAKGESNLIGVRSRGMADQSVQYLNLDWPMNLAPIIDKYTLKPRLL